MGPRNKAFRVPRPRHSRGDWLIICVRLLARAVLLQCVRRTGCGSRKEALGAPWFWHSRGNCLIIGCAPWLGQSCFSGSGDLVAAVLEMRVDRFGCSTIDWPTIACTLRLKQSCRNVLGDLETVVIEERFGRLGYGTLAATSVVAPAPLGWGNLASDCLTTWLRQS